MFKVVRVGFVLVWGLLASSGWGQTCNANLVQGNSFVIRLGGDRIGGLQRTPNASYTLQELRWYDGSWPAIGPSLLALTGYEQIFLNCSAAFPRSFQLPAGWNFLADQLGTSSRNPVIGDLIGDGTLFAIGANDESGDAMDVVIANPDGTVKSSTILPTGLNPANFLVGDFNGDGKRDLLVVNFGDGQSNNGQVTVYLSNGDGTLKPGISSPAGIGPGSAAALDFNKDGMLDVVVANFSGTVSYLKGNGDGTFAAPIPYSTGIQAISVAAADLNNDGNADLVVGDASGSNTAGKLVVLLGNGDGTFNPATTIASNLTPTGVAIGDLNHDGKPDLALTDWNSGILTVMLGDGMGGFSLGGRYLAIPGSLFVTDFDGDGNLDVVIAAGHPDGLSAQVAAPAMMVLFGKGDGTLIGAPAYATGSLTANVPNSLAAADFNGDSKLDLIVTANNSKDLWVLLGSGGGAFQTPTRIASPSSSVWPGAVVAANLTPGGNQDVIFADQAGSNVWVLLGNGTGTFQPPLSYTIGGVYPSSIAVGDFNGDHQLDLVVAYSGGVAVLLGNGTGGFLAPTPLNGGANPQAVAVGDFNQDGKLDFAVVNQGAGGADNGGVLIFLGQGNGSFLPPVSYPAGVGPASLAVGDLNNDGLPDLVVGTGNGQFGYVLTVLLGNASHTFTAVPGTFSTDFNPQSIALADLNGDGNLDVSVAHCCGTSLEVGYFLGNGNGTLQAEATAPTPAIAAQAVLAADFEGNGKKDLAVAVGQNGFPSYVSILRQFSMAQVSIQTVPAGLSFSVDGGPTQTISAVSLPPGTYTIAVAATQPGQAGSQYVFQSWSDGGAISHTITVSGSPITLTATYKTQYQLTISASPAAGGAVTPASNFFDADSVQPISAAVNSGYTFAGWTGSVASASSASTSVTMSASETVVANFSALASITIQTTPPGLQFTVDGGGVQTAPQTLTLSQGSHTISVATTQAGAAGTQYVFTNWSDSGAASHSINVTAAAAIYTAAFQTQFQLTISASPAGAGTVTPPSGFFNANSVTPIAAAANSGYAFGGWTGSVASAGSASTGVTMSAPETVVANFSSLTGITIQTSPPGLQFTVDGGAAQTSPETLDLSQGPHTLAAVTTQPGAAGTQYVFASWSDGGAASHSITVTSSAATFTASFTTQYQLTMTASPAAGGTVTPPSGTYYNAGVVNRSPRLPAAATRSRDGPAASPVPTASRLP